MTMERQTTQQPEMQSPPISKEELFSLRDVLEGMSPLELQAHKLKMLNGISDREAIVHLINDVLDGNGVI